MPRFLDHAGGIADPVQYLLNDSGHFAQTGHPAIAMNRPRNVCSPDDVGQPVDTRAVPDFWQPIEEWMVD